MIHSITLFCTLVLFVIFSMQHDTIQHTVSLEHFVNSVSNYEFLDNDKKIVQNTKNSEVATVTKELPESTGSCKTRVQMPFELRSSSKCVDCNDEIINNMGPSYAYYKQMSKCFNCSLQPEKWGEYPSIQ